MTMVAGRHDTPGSPTERARSAKHGFGGMRAKNCRGPIPIVESALRLVCGTLVLPNLVH